MIVHLAYTNHPEIPLTEPFPKRNRFGVGLLKRKVYGDLCDPQDGNWFKAPFPTIVNREYVNAENARIYVAWNIFGWCGYIGAKVYGVDSPEYKNWLPAEDVYEGSLAFCLTARPFALDHQ